MLCQSVRGLYVYEAVLRVGLRGQVDNTPPLRDVHTERGWQR